MIIKTYGVMYKRSRKSLKSRSGKPKLMQDS